MRKKELLRNLLKFSFSTLSVFYFFFRVKINWKEVNKMADEKAKSKDSKNQSMSDTTEEMKRNMPKKDLSAGIAQKQ